MKTLLVTGGCGFIGSNFSRLFLRERQDWRLINLDKLTYSGNRENIRDLEQNGCYEFVQGDICNDKLVMDLLSRADGVINFAAETHVDRSIEAADSFLKTNISGLEVLLRCARAQNVQKFLHISTDEVYGSLKEGSASENARLLPNSPYSASKAGADLLARSYFQTYGYPVMIVRSSNNYGPYQFPEKVIPLFITNLLEDKKVPLYGTGINQRDWIFVEDNCRAIALVFEKGEPGQIYNIGVGNEITNLELTQELIRLLGKTKDSIQYVEDRLGHDLRYSLSVDKVKKLGFEPQWSFEKGLQHTIQWYREHEDWWRPLKKDKYTVK